MMQHNVSNGLDNEILHVEIKKPLERCSILRNCPDENIQDDLFRHLYLVLKPNEEHVNEATIRTLRLIEQEVRDYAKEGGHNETEVTIGYTFRDGELHKHGDDLEFHVRNTVNSLFPHQQSRPASPINEEKKVLNMIENGVDEKKCTIKRMNLTSPLKVPVTTSASDVLKLCEKMETINYTENLIYDEDRFQLLQPEVKMKLQNNCHLKVPLIYVDNKSEAESDALRSKCLDSPLVLIRGLVEACDIQMGRFTSKEINELAGDHKMELREQWLLSNVMQKSNWYYPSYEKSTRLSNYTNYQGKMFADMISDAYKILDGRRKKRARFAPYDLPNVDSPRSMERKNGKAKFYFGTNLDFSERIFNRQVAELQKLPPFLKVHDKSNFLSYLSLIKGMNSAQFYMKIKNCRTPAHLENNTFCSVNLNIGQGDCEWFGIPYEYYPIVDEMCKQKKLNFLSSAWWPVYEELIAANIPVYRFTQRRGDVVFVNGGTIHWVEASGFTNNVAWNVGPACVEQYKLNIMSMEWNLSRKFVSLVPVEYMTWKLAKEFRTNDHELYKMIRGVLIRSFAYTIMTLDYARKRGLRIEMISEELNLKTTNCTRCTAEIFNCIFVISLPLGNSYEPFCLQCIQQENESKVELWQVFELDYLKETLDNFKPQDC
ncbi:JmjC domain protein [Aphelenchoides besseyi]|nr:JmjC domain protein [Aphelenchoides besseyi]